MAPAVVETLLTATATGKAMLLEPWISSAIIATVLIRELGSAQQRQEMLPAMAAGERIAVPAHFEPGARHDLQQIATAARRSGGAWTVKGRSRWCCMRRPLISCWFPRAPPALRTSPTASRCSRWRAMGRACRSRRTARWTHVRCRCGADRRARRAHRRGRRRLRLPSGSFRSGPRRQVRRGGGRAAGHSRRDRGIHEDAPAVRRSHRQVPGTATPHGGHAHPRRAGPLDELPCRDARRRAERPRASSRAGGSQGGGGRCLPLRRPAGGAAPRRHGGHRRDRREPPLPPPDGAGDRAGRYRASSGAVRGGERGGGGT